VEEISEFSAERDDRMKVKLRTSRDAAKKLLTAIKAGKLQKYNVSSGRLVTGDFKYAAPKKAAPKKSAAIKLSETQKTLLKQIADTKATGLVGNQRAAKTLNTLQAKKLIRKGKKEGHQYRYFITKLGEKKSVGGQAGPAPGSSA
jgi:hypothetical protein